MADYIDETYWRKALSQPNWYLLLKDDFERLEELSEKEDNYAKRKQIKDKAYSLVEEAVSDGRLPIAEIGDNLDAERKPVDTIVVHHTKNRPGMTLAHLNAVQLLRIYGRYFANPTDAKEKHLKGQLIWSGHFYNSKQVFWGYHWLIREDGSSERILDDNYVGWHAGNWDVNTRSVGICIDDDLSDKKPSETVIQAVANIIKQHYPNVNWPKILGHCEVNNNTECPGYLFLESWKHQLTANLH